MKNLSRVCGDDPVFIPLGGAGGKFVPRMRGCSVINDPLQMLINICPAYAGMLLHILFMYYSSVYLSRVCGDAPLAKD